jgi:hypothetical protein
MIAFTVWMIIDAGKQDRFWWLTLIIGVPVIGAAAYYFTEKKHEYRSAPLHYVHISETEQQHEKAPKKKAVRKAKKEVSSEPVSLSNGEVKAPEGNENKAADTVASV